MRHTLITLLIITGVVICSWEAGVVPGEALRSRDQQPCTKLFSCSGHDNFFNLFLYPTIFIRWSSKRYR